MALPKISERNIQIFYIVEFCRSLIFTIPVWIAFLQSRITVSQISFFVAASFLTQLLLELPTGAFADLVGKRVTVAFAYFIDAVYYSLFAFVTTFPQLLILAILGGTAEALRSGSTEALVYDSLKQDGKEDEFRAVMAKNGVRFQIGLVIGTLSGGFLALVWSPLPFMMTASFSLFAAILSLWIVEPAIDSEKFTLRNYLRQIKWGAIEAFKSATHRYVSLYYIAVGSISWMCATYFNDYILIDLGFGSEWRGIIGAALRVINVTLLAKLLTNEKLFSFRNTIMFFPILMVFGLLPGQWLVGTWGIPFVGMIMMASTARWILLGKYTNAVFDSKYRATAISTLSMTIGIVYVIGVALSGPIIARWGDSRLMYSLLGILSLMTIPLLAYKVLKQHET